MGESLGRTFLPVLGDNNEGKLPDTVPGSPANRNDFSLVTVPAFTALFSPGGLAYSYSPVIFPGAVIIYFTATCSIFV